MIYNLERTSPLRFSYPSFSTILDQFKTLSTDLDHSKKGIFIYGDNRPKMNIYQLDKDFIIKVALAGYNKDDVAISLSESSRELILCYQEEVKSSEGTYYLGEISRSNFSRTIVLPEFVDLTKYETKYEDGLLTIKFNVIEQSSKYTPIKF